MNAAFVLFHDGTASARLPRGLRLLALLAFAAGIGLPLGLQAQSLPDTGRDTCFDGSSMVSCSGANTGDASAYPRQDGRFGRDPAFAQGAFSKTGGGAKGFDYTKIGASGAALTIQNGTWATSGGYDSGSEAAGTKWSCVLDNVTGLTWEVKTHDATRGLRDWDNGYTWYDGNVSTNGGNAGDTGADTCHGTLTPVYGPYCNTQNYASAVNAANLCGHNDWRVPSMRELLTLVHFGAYNPTVDASYFPDSQSAMYWTASTYNPGVAYGRAVDFTTGELRARNKTYSTYVRLVRGAPF